MNDRNKEDHLLPAIHEQIAETLGTIEDGQHTHEMWVQWDTGKRYSRIQRFLEDFKQDLEKKASQSARRPVSDAELQLLEVAVERVRAEHREKKRRRFAALAASSWTTDRDLPFEERELFLRALDAFDELHLAVLDYVRSMTTGGKHPTYDDIAANTLRSGMSIDERDSLLLSALNILAGSFGFIRRDWSLSGRGGHLLSSSGFSPEGIARKCGHAITEPGRRFLQSVMIEE